MKSNTQLFDQKMINYCINIQKNITKMPGDNILLQFENHQSLLKSPILSLGKIKQKHNVIENHREITVIVICLLKSLTLSPSKKGESGDNRVK